MRLSLVIPAYNEAMRIGQTLTRAADYLSGRDYDAEIIVVDDGSADDTAGVVRAMQKTTAVPLRLHRFDVNRGKGAAVQQGMLREASGAFRFFYDADGSTPIDEVEVCWPRFEDGADIVIGSRALPGSHIELHQRWYREQMGRINNRFLRLFGLTPFQDTQCGFKGFTAKAAEICFSRQTIERFAFDVEVLFIAARHGLRIDEAPIHWHNSPQSRVNPVSDSLRMIRESLQVRANARAGKYD